MGVDNIMEDTGSVDRCLFDDPIRNRFHPSRRRSSGYDDNIIGSSTTTLWGAHDEGAVASGDFKHYFHNKFLPISTATTDRSKRGTQRNGNIHHPTSTKNSTSPSASPTVHHKVLGPATAARKRALLHLPIETMKEYVTIHSSDVLRREFPIQNANKKQTTDRKFLVVYYSCPHAAGNLLHDTYNQVIAGIATNRTILIKYNDHVTCQYNQLTNHNSTRCRKANTLEDCQQSLLQQSWIPTWDEFIIPISEASSSVPVDQVPHNVDDPFWLLKLPKRDTKYTDDDWSHELFMTFPVFQYYVHSGVGGIWGHAPVNQQTLKDLYSLGADFLYGMLFHELFRWNPNIIPPEMAAQQQVARDQSETTTSTTKIVLHSRHFDVKNKGGNIRTEIGCLKELLRSDKKITKKDDHDESCEIYLMSDREITVDNLKTHIDHRYKHCKAIVATHDMSFMTSQKSQTTKTLSDSSVVGSSDNGTHGGKQQQQQQQQVVVGHYAEHGVWAGMGFMQDIMLATSSLRDGFIGHCYRSSSQLIRELMVYDRHMDALQS
eukprot:CAMPEP_0113475110 /NCGR_PEP_ID=MMETSP0014_2-20120614/18945_1 /TAXON_ID=2857 /ORGANISM="Nitzschia sp." /LENGTH=545 /DNA_ID=CAMNT_0000368007 /DNA_START=36 /DNA_END=1670 /DNA_ORIENTATION=- /assembly_acc=CAM_ASM_000159